jgi:serine protease AprX
MRQANHEYAPLVINLSLGAPDDGNPNNPIRAACRTAVDNLIWVMAAAGNGGPNPGTIWSPAADPKVMGIGAVYVDRFEVASFSSRGPTIEGYVKPDAVSFGSDLWLADSKSDTSYSVRSGTSFASPAVAGTAAVAIEAARRFMGMTVPLAALAGERFRLGLTIGQIAEIAARSCVKPAGAPAGKDNSYGYGLPFGELIMQNMQSLTTAVGALSTVQPVVTLMGMALVMGMMGSLARGIAMGMR